MSSLLTSATRSSRSVCAAVSTAFFAASSHDFSLVPIISVTLYTLFPDALLDFAMANLLVEYFHRSRCEPDRPRPPPRCHPRDLQAKQQVVFALCTPGGARTPPSSDWKTRPARSGIMHIFNHFESEPHDLPRYPHRRCERTGKRSGSADLCRTGRARHAHY